MNCDGHGRTFFSSDLMLQTHDQVKDFHSCAPQDFDGVQMRRSMSFSGMESRCEEMLHVEDDMSDDGSQQLGGEKKKRLSRDQVKALEKSFELNNKLEPERKLQLARALGLQTRQVAIWYQNRRARCKTKQLERDYDQLRRKFEALKSDNDALLDHNKKLHHELLALKGEKSTGVGVTIHLNKETEGCWSNGSTDQSRCGVNLGPTVTPPPIDNPIFSRQISDKHIFHSSVTHLLQSSSPPSRSDLFQCQEIDQTATDESLCNMLISTISEDGNPGFWPWPEQQHFH